MGDCRIADSAVSFSRLNCQWIQPVNIVVNFILRGEKIREERAKKSEGKRIFMFMKELSTQYAWKRISHLPSCYTPRDFFPLQLTDKWTHSVFRFRRRVAILAFSPFPLHVPRNIDLLGFMKLAGVTHRWHDVSLLAIDIGVSALTIIKRYILW